MIGGGTKVPQNRCTACDDLQTLGGGRVREGLTSLGQLSMQLIDGLAGFGPGFELELGDLTVDACVEPLLGRVQDHFGLRNDGAGHRVDDEELLLDTESWE